ncbi:MAG: acyltransferase family protein [Clostridium sp.]
MLKERKQEKKQERNKTLDYIRSINMWYIILVIHFLFWLGFGSKMEYSTICLVEMFVVFFLMGTSLKYEKEVTYLQYLKKKFNRVYVPYLIFAIFSVILILIGTKYNLIPVRYNVLSTSVLEGIFNPLSQKFNFYHFSYIYYQVWFIPVFIMLTLYMPILTKMMKKNILVTFFASILIYAIFKNLSITVINPRYKFMLPIIYNFKISLFYVPFIIIGYKYEWFLKNKFKTFILTILSIILFLLLYLNGEHNMQKLKFEFTKEYFLLGTSFILILLLIYPYISKLINKFKALEKYLMYFAGISYHAYLYHSIAYSIAVIVVKNISNMYIKYGLILLLVFTLTNILSIIFFKLEKYIMKIFNRIANKYINSSLNNYIKTNVSRVLSKLK